MLSDGTALLRWAQVRALSAAARIGNEKMLRYLHARYTNQCTWQVETNDDDGRTLNTLGFVMESDHLDLDETDTMLTLCRTLGCPITMSAFMSAAGAEIHMLQSFKHMQWLLDEKCTLGPAICSSAVSQVSRTFNRHQLEKWSWRGDSMTHRWPVALLDELIGHGKPTGVLHWPLAKLQWLRARGVPWSSGTMSAAVKYGNIELMSWVLANGGEMSANSMAMGAYHGTLYRAPSDSPSCPHALSSFRTLTPIPIPLPAPSNLYPGPFLPPLQHPYPHPI